MEKFKSDLTFLTSLCAGRCILAETFKIKDVLNDSRTIWMNGYFL